MTSLEDIFNSEFGSGYGAIVNGVGYIPVDSSLCVEMFGYSEQDIVDQDEIDNFFEFEMLEDHTQEDDEYAEREMRDELISNSCSYLNEFCCSTVQLHNDLFIYSVDSRVGF